LGKKKYNKKNKLTMKEKEGRMKKKKKITCCCNAAICAISIGFI